MTTTLIQVYNNQPVVSSRTVAEDFGKQHKHVIEAIENIKAENSAVTSMFYETTYTAGTGKAYKMYLMNRDGFSLLVMGFTGKQALDWKIQYINAFNAMEKQLATPKLTPAPRFRARHLSTALKDMEKTKETLQKMFKVADGLAYSKAISMIEPLYGVSFDSIKELLPAAEHQTGYMTPSEIGARLNKSAREVNLLLAGYGYQHKEGKVWRLDAAGKAYGEEIPYTAPTGHSGYQIRWNEKVLQQLQAVMEGADAK